eukprot:3761382-Prymnesium_polylepis.1
MPRRLRGARAPTARRAPRATDAVSARSHASAAGRTFEWWLEAIDARHEIASCKEEGGTQAQTQGAKQRQSQRASSGVTFSAPL